jgi:predicted glycosyltransferase
VSGPPRIAIFTHDTFGLGHVRRCLHFVRALAGRAPEAAILFVTGSPALHALGSLPPNADFVKIPTLAKTGEKRLRPPHLPLPLDAVSSLRATLIREAILRFAPHVFLVDNFPLGSRGELLSTLQGLDRRRTRTVLGLRDILDAPEAVRTDWTRQGIYEVLRRHYDRILVYGVRQVLDVEEAYGLPADVAARVHYCGYVTGNGGERCSAAEVRRELGFDAPFLLATGGGGGDGFPLLSTVLDALPLIPRVPAMVLTGPLMGDAQRAQLREKLGGRSQVTVREFVPDLRRYMDAAGVVVAMCGYNTAAEIMELQPRAIVVPRTWRYGEHLSRETAGVEWEQVMRARALADLGLAQVLEPRSLTPAALAERIRGALDRGSEPRRRVEVDLQGLRRVTDHILAMTGDGSEEADVGR